ncbi:nucleotidyltransferase family protein [Panacibacter ginsenosidivorans]|uniref:Nucleotidyltransferase family protein n=1 Tax=Panacibacter ginsenosidivorans TaxID=1813871 RepID=A0A5B8VDN7_9BACT|nr:nucleotidyltransferase family protein [Panacibacter ginsenosidivorans]QEC69113.1 nucleotidyltransferase family protein [Panacibacter ginsenosidivorans]
MVSAIVLAAGLSKRMGNENKLLLPYNGKTIIETTLQHLLDAGIEEIIVVTGHEAQLVSTTIRHLPVIIIYNPLYEKGMTTSIQKGVEVAAGSGYMICLADMFSITALEYISIITAFETQLQNDEKCICVPRYKNEKGNPVIFSAAYRADILQHKEMEGCKKIVEQNKTHIHRIDMQTPHILEDLDYPDDYKKISME